MNLLRVSVLFLAVFCANVIGVFVGDEDGVDVAGMHAARGEAAFEFARAEAAIKHHAGIAASHQQRVARAAASQRRELHARVRRGGP